MALEAALMPDLIQAPESLDRVNSFITSCTLARAHGGGVLLWNALEFD